MCTIVKNKFFIFLIAGVLLSVSLNAQTGYKYSVDLNNVQKDELTVELLCPQITEKEIVILDIWDTRQNPENFPIK